MVSSNLFGEGWTVQTSNNNGYDAYNIIASSYGDDGGFHIFGSNVSGFYQVSVAFTNFGDPADENDVWGLVEGLSGGSNTILISANSADEWITHTQLSAVTNWPDLAWTGLITVAIHDFEQPVDPDSDPTNQFYFDLDPPEITAAIVECDKDAPFNQSYPHYAAIGDIIKLSMTTDQDVAEVEGSIGPFDVTPSGLNSSSPNASVSVTSVFDEGVVDFSVSVRDQYGNESSNVSEPIPNTTSVIVDTETPSVTCAECYVTMKTTPDDDYYAKNGDDVILEIQANEVLVQGDFDGDGDDDSDYMVVNIGNETNTTVLPSLSGTAGNLVTYFSATLELNNSRATHGENVSFTLSGVVDRAGNDLEAVTTTTDGLYIYYDSVLPTMESVEFTSAALNANPDPLFATSGNNVVLSFQTSEVVQTSPSVIFRGGGDNVAGDNPNGAQYNATVTQGSGGSLFWDATLEITEGIAEGYLTFSIDVSDLSDNDIAAPATALDDNDTRIKIDYTGPTIANLEISSSSGTGYANYGQTVTISVESDDALRYIEGSYEDGVSGTIGGLAADATRQTSTTWILETEMGDAHPQEELQFSLTMTDEAGNVTVAENGDITDGSSVTYDKTLPTLAVNNFYSTNAVPTLAKDGDDVTIIFQTSEDLAADPTVLIANTTATKDAQDNRTYTYTVEMDESSHDDGQITVTIDFTDLAENDAVTVTENDIATAITYDETAPLINTVYYYNSTTGSDDQGIWTDYQYAKAGEQITMKITANEDLMSDPIVWIGRNDGAGDFADGNKAVLGQGANAQEWVAVLDIDDGGGLEEEGLPHKVTFNDVVGNVGTVNTTLKHATDDVNPTRIRYDETVPVPAFTYSSDNDDPTLATSGNTITVGISVTTNVQAPVVSIYGQSSADADSRVTVAENGTKALWTAEMELGDSDADINVIPVSVTATDSAGNVSDVVDAPSNDATVSYDKTSPIIESISIVSDNTDVTKAKTGDSLTVEIVTSENLKTGDNPSVTILGVSIESSRNAGKNDEFTVGLKLTGAETETTIDATNTDESVFSISSYQDPTGNAGATYTAPTSGEVTYDRTLPTVDLVAITSTSSGTNYNSEFAKDGDNIVLTVYTSEEVDDLNDTDLLGSNTGLTIAALDIPTNRTWSITKAVDGTAHAALTNTLAPFNIHVSDPTGNGSTSDAYQSLAGTGDINFDGIQDDEGTVTIDLTLPNFDSPPATYVRISSSNENGATLSVPGDRVTLSFKSSEVIQEPTVTISGQTATMLTPADPNDIPTDTWVYYYDMTTNDSDNPSTVAFSITYADRAGNGGAAAQVALVDDEDGAVTFDKTQPELNAITFESDNDFNNAFAKPNSILTLTFRANEELLEDALDVFIAGSERPVSVLTSWAASGNLYEEWAATYTITDAYDDNDGDGAEVPFTIDYVDLNGYQGVQVVATSDGSTVTFDKTAPEIQTLTYETDNDNDPALCRVQDVVTTTFEADELVQQPTILIGGNGADEVVGGTPASWTGTYTMQGDDDEGDVSISAAFMDYAGNSGITHTATTDLETITFDRTIPELENITISSSNPYGSSLATTGDLITIEIESDEPLFEPPTLTMVGNDIAAPNLTGSGTDWEGVYPIQPGDVDGAVSFSFAFEDLAANPGVTVNATSDATSVTIDQTASILTTVAIDLVSGSDVGLIGNDNLTNDTTPTFDITNLPNGAIGDSIYLVIDGDTTARDAALSSSLSLTSSELDDNVLGFSVTVVARDPTGNLSLPSPAMTLRIDTQAPIITTAPNLMEEDDTGFYNNDDVTNVFQPHLILSGLPAADKDSLRLFYDTGPGRVFCGAYRMRFTTLDTVQVLPVLDDEEYTFSFMLIDSAGNESDFSNPLTVTIDAINPDQPTTPDLTAASDGGSYPDDDVTNNTTITFGIGTVSTGDRLFILADDIELDFITVTGEGYDLISIDNAESADYTAYAMDVAGNVSPSSGSLSIIVDVTPPVNPIEIDLPYTSDTGVDTTDNLTNDYTPQIDVIKINDAGTTTGTDSAYLYVDGVINQRLQTSISTVSFTTDSLSDNIHVLSVRTRDLAGNISDEGENDAENPLTIRVDNTPPPTPPNSPNLIPADDTGESVTDDTTYVTDPQFQLTSLPVDLDSISLYYDVGTGNILGQTMRMSESVMATIQMGTNLDDGTYAITYVIEDSAGNISSFSPALTLAIDIVPPEVPDAPTITPAYDTGESNSDNITNEMRPELIITGVSAGDYGSLYMVSNLDAVDPDVPDTVFVDKSISPPDDATITFTTPMLSTGFYDFYVVANDTAGNTSESGDLSVEVDQIDPTCDITFDGDALVRFDDLETIATFTFDERMNNATLPTVDVDYPEGEANDLTGQVLTPLTVGNDSVWTFAIPLNTAGLENIDGIITLSITAEDIAGNVILPNNTTGLSDLRVDNTDPAFSSFTPDTGAYINDLSNFGWSLSENLESGSVLFEWTFGPGEDATVTLTGNELVAGVHPPASFIGGDPALVDGTIYDIVFISADTAGNPGNDKISTVTYDITTPTGALTFSHLYVSEDSVLTITAQFDERIMPTPTISIDYAGVGDDVSSEDLTIGVDSTVWSYDAIMPDGETNNGPVVISIDATDLADNALNPNDLTQTDTVVLDNTLPAVSFSYVNLTTDTVINKGKAGDLIEVTGTFNEPANANIPPVMNVYYATDSELAVAYVSTADDDSTWVFQVTLPAGENNTGYMNVTLDAMDLAGNPIANYTNADIFLLDNTLPAYSGTSPDSGAYVSHTNVGYTLSESILTGTVTWTRLSGNEDVNSPHVVDLVAAEMQGGVAYSDYSLVNGPDSSEFPLVSETYYSITFSATDSSGNVSFNFVESPIYYDTTAPTGALSFSHLYVSEDSLVVITANFNERVLPTPSISIDYNGENDDVSATNMEMAPDDSTEWSYTAIIPGGIDNQGNVGFAISAIDMATNELVTLTIIDSLYVDNTIATATLSYLNLTQPDIGDYGHDGDTIRVTATMNEPILTIDPVPKLNLTYLGIFVNTEGDTIPGDTVSVNAVSSSNDDSVWVFDHVLYDGENNWVFNDGTLQASLTAKDRSGNFVNAYINNASFQVDNTHPDTFSVGDVIMYGLNPVQGWINGMTDTIEVKVPITSFLDDPSLDQGELRIQIQNLTRDTTWNIVLPNDTINEGGGLVGFFRTKSQIDSVMVPGTDLVLGDSLKISAKIKDHFGNATFDSSSAQIVVYDPNPPIKGSEIGGNFFSDDTIYSSDMITYQWSPFMDYGDDEVASGTERYEYAIEKIGDASISEFSDWTSTGLDEEFTFVDFLMHDSSYVAHVRAFDVAGNISDTLHSDTLVRYNTAPTIIMDSSFATVGVSQLEEDTAWTATVYIEDQDLDVLQGDSFIYQATTTRIIGDVATSAVSIAEETDTTGILTWEPTQDDTGYYEIDISVTDEYGFTSTFTLTMEVQAVNDPPKLSIEAPDDALEWEEDTNPGIINLSSYVVDVDNEPATLFWDYEIVGVDTMDEDYYQTQIDIPSALFTVDTARQENGEMFVSIQSAEDYYDPEIKIYFTVSDSSGLSSTDSIMVNIIGKNDPPVIDLSEVGTVYGGNLDTVKIWENDSIWMDFAPFATDIDNTELDFAISAITNSENMTITPSGIENSIGAGDTVLFTPAKLWSNEATIQVIAADLESSDTATFILDILRVNRPELSIALIQNNAFTHYLQVIIVDTEEKTQSIELNIQSENIDIDSVADYTYTADFSFLSSGVYSFDIEAHALVGDTLVTEDFTLAAATQAGRWTGRSYDGKFSVAGDLGTVASDQIFLIADSTLFTHDFYDQASYVFGDESFTFQKAVEIRLENPRDDLALYRRKHGVTWEELPSLNIDSTIFTLSEKTGYYRLGPKTIIVPEKTNIHQNYPNPFNPVTTIKYDIGLLDGLRQNLSIKIYNLLGQHIETLVNNRNQIGQHTIQWNGKDKFGQPMASGVYFVQLTTQTGIVKNMKVMLLK